MSSFEELAQMFFTLFFAMAVVLRPIATIIKSSKFFIRDKFYMFGFGAKIVQIKQITKLF
jgi:hypothetical protein